MTLSVALKAQTPIPLAVAFTVAPGELLALVGHSGSSKTTILRSIAGLCPPQEARISVTGKTRVDTAAGVVPPAHRRHVCVVFQSYALFPHMTAARNVMVALARALARKPAAPLLDEPFSAVDRAKRERLHAEILALRAHLKMPVGLVTHDMNEVPLLADRMMVIETCRLVREGTTAAVMADPDALRALGVRELAALLHAVVGGDRGGRAHPS